jgi:ATP-dependent RNA helicase DeaD
MTKFEDFGLDKRLIRAIGEIGYAEPTPIQEKCIAVISKGSDCVAQSSTGSGKTAAFGLPILEKINKGTGLQFVVLTPTRELCLQVKDALVQFSKYLGLTIAAVYGGAPMGRQIEALRVSEVMVGTPGRVLDHLQNGRLPLDKVRFLVLDEADRMLDMGFIDDVMKITSRMPKDKQTMLFSATIPNEIRNVISRNLREPVYVKTESYVDKSHLHQIFYSLRQEEKFSLLTHLLKTKSKGFALVFCATRRRVDALTRNLITQGVEAIAIHGGMPQNRRLKALDRLKRSTIHVLVATDVAARGLDIKNITHIYNYDVPKTSDEYIHRIGRTARAGAEGDAITFVASVDHDNFRAVLSDKSLELRQENLPDHERLPYTAKGGGGNRRGLPEGVSRTGKPKSHFSNTHPRPNPNAAENNTAARGDAPTGKYDRKEFYPTKSKRDPSRYQWPKKHSSSQPASQSAAPQHSPHSGGQNQGTPHQATHPHPAGQDSGVRNNPSQGSGRPNRRGRRFAHRNSQQQRH